jgi:predicted ribonuclease YlaK
MRTVYVIDTSFLMNYPDIVQALGNEYGAHVYIHKASLLELEAIKNDRLGQKTPEQRKKASDAAYEVNSISKKLQIGGHILNKGKDSYLYITDSNAEYAGMASRGDRCFLGLISELKKKYTEDDEVVALITDNSAEIHAKLNGAWVINRYKFEPWDILRVKEYADKEEIETARKDILKKYHHDKLASRTDLTDTERKYAEERSKEANAIWTNFKNNNYKKYWNNSDYGYVYKGNGSSNSSSYAHSNSNNQASSSNPSDDEFFNDELE